MNEFQRYLELYEIDLVRLSIEAHVRYLTVYNAQKGLPLVPENAHRIKETVLRLTGVPYDGSFVLIELNDEPFRKRPPKQLPKTLPGESEKS